MEWLWSPFDHDYPTLRILKVGRLSSRIILSIMISHILSRSTNTTSHLGHRTILLGSCAGSRRFCFLWSQTADFYAPATVIQAVGLSDTPGKNALFFRSSIEAPAATLRVPETSHASVDTYK